MDQELKLILKLEGQDKLKALAGYVGDVTKALGEREKAGKALAQTIKTEATAEELLHGAYEKERAILVNLKNVSHEYATSVTSDHGKLMNSYFKTGEELRRFFQQQRLGNRIFSESGQVVNSFASIIGGSQISNAFSSLTNNFQSLEFAVQGVAIATANVGGKMSAFGNVLAGLAAPITILGAGILWLVNRYGELQKAIDESSKAMAQSFSTHRKEYFGLSAQQEVDALEKDRQRLQEKVNRATAGLLGYEASTPGSGAEKAIKDNMIAMYHDELVKRNKELFELDVQIKKLKEEMIKGRLGVAAPLPEDIELLPADAIEEFWKTHEYSPSQGFIQSMTRGGEYAPTPLTTRELMGTGQVGRLGAMGRGRGISGVNIPGALAGVKAKPTDWGRSKEVKVAFDELSQESQAFYTSMQSMTGMLGNAIVTHVGGAFRKVFGEGEDLAADLLTTVFSTLINFGLSSATGGIFRPMSMVTGLAHNAPAANNAQLVGAVMGLTKTLANGSLQVRGTSLALLQDKVSRRHAATKL